MPRALRIIQAQVRASLLVGATYRVDFLVDAAIEILWTATTLAPLVILGGLDRDLAGWSFGEALVVVAFFTMLQAILEGVLNPSFGAAVELARRGGIDAILMKPADAQLLLATGRMLPSRAVNVATSLVMLLVAFARLGRVPSLPAIAASVVAFAAAVGTLFALFTLALSTVLVWVRTEGATDLLSGVLDAARWPVTVFRGSLRLLLTFVVPLGLMTTYPARALLGTLDARLLLIAVLEAALLLALSRAAFDHALRVYRSGRG